MIGEKILMVQNRLLQYYPIYLNIPLVRILLHLC